MLAFVLRDIGKLEYKNIGCPSIQPGWVLVKVCAAGICGSDIPRIFETGTYHFPTIPGHEFAGIVVEVADQQHRGWVGKRVGVFPLIPCQQCECCKREAFEMCHQYNYLGSRTDGGFAEYVAVPVRNLVEIPQTVSMVEGAMLEPMAVARHAISKLHITEIENLAIWGLGTIGLLMAQWARIAGVKQIFLVANKKEQLELAERLGFYNICLSTQDDPVEWLRSRTGRHGVDAAIEGVGSSEVMCECLNAVREEGQIVAVGNPKRDLQLRKADYWQILRKQLRLSGTWNSRFATQKEDDWKAALKALEQKTLSITDLVTHRLPFAQLPEGLEIMKEKKEYFCKIMLIMEE